MDVEIREEDEEEEEGESGPGETADERRDTGSGEEDSTPAQTPTRKRKEGERRESLDADKEVRQEEEWGGYKIPKKRSKKASEEERTEDGMVERILSRIVPQIENMLEGAVGARVKGDKSERWQEATDKFPDIDLLETRNQNKYNAWKTVCRWLEVAKGAGDFNECLEAVHKAALCAEKRAAVVTVGDKEGWKVASAFSFMQQGCFLDSYKGDITVARKLGASLPTKKKGTTGIGNTQSAAFSGNNVQLLGTDQRVQMGQNNIRRGPPGVCFVCRQPSHVARDCNRVQRQDGPLGSSQR